MAKECGSCTLCCKLLAIEELQKPHNQWCPHCEPGKGCGIYSQRPPSCREFQCLWLSTPELPEELRPSRCKVVLGLTVTGHDVVVYQSPETPDTYRTNKHLRGFITSVLASGVDVIIAIGEQRKLLKSAVGSQGGEPVDLALHLPAKDSPFTVLKKPS